MDKMGQNFHKIEDRFFPVFFYDSPKSPVHRLAFVKIARLNARIFVIFARILSFILSFCDVGHVQIRGFTHLRLFEFLQF